MSPLESWLLNNALEIIAVTTVGIMAWVKLQSQADNSKILKDSFDRHLASDSPHLACPVHKAKFEDVVATLERIEKRLETMDARFYSLLKANGYRDGEDK